MEHPEVEEDGRMSGTEERVSDMEQEDSLGLMGGRDSPLKPDGGVGGGVVEGEDILAKLRQQVSAASIFSQAAREGGLGSTPPPGSPNNNNNNNGHNLYDRLHTLLQAKMKREEDGDGEEDSRDLVLRAEALHRQRESLLSSPQALMNAMRGGGPPSLVPPGPHLPFIPSTVGLPPTTQMPPTPGSAGSRDSSGNGARTPSHTPEPHQSQQSWSFEEQFKQVREPTKHSSFEEDKRKLYELSDDVKRKEFLDELFSFMQKRGTPINRLPIMAKQVLDLYELYKLVVERGGLVDVINKKLWQEIIKGLKLPSSITSAAFTLRTQYMKYLYPLECEKMKLSNPTELQNAIDGNRREGRRSSYGNYGDTCQPPMLPLQNLQSLQNLQNLQNPLSLVPRPQLNGNGTAHPLAPQEYLLGRGGSPPGSQEALLEATRLTMWKLYNQGLGVGGGFQHEDDGPKLPPPHHPLAGVPFPPQKEALNLEVKDERPGRLKDAVDHRNDLRNDLRNDVRNDLRNDLRNDFRSDLRNDMRSRLEDSTIPPAAKRQAQQEDSHDPRLPPPTTPTNAQSGANIKITSRGDGRSQDQSLVVSMEINGTLYQGVLFAQAPRARFS
ncbi:protein dead ringer homolog isoform X2 [Portunus trituberculatus]|uniref:protein dead ringer homolog isoform X2 n=1 Tax=Portunus trituberculatus TaxID=210409 RepID=UPI001E1CE8CC|nr:protein dead ringer homolog isoform X2 [Portunus trituberculatus]